MKTYSQKETEVKRVWHILDASNVAMGRVSTVAASLLLGKGKPTVTNHTDGGDFVIIINVGAIKFTGNKADQKLYQNHSGFPGGLRIRRLGDISKTEALSKSIRGMLPVNKLREARLARLKIYEGSEHNHSAQKPKMYKMETK